LIDIKINPSVTNLDHKSVTNDFCTFYNTKEAIYIYIHT